MWRCWAGTEAGSGIAGRAPIKAPRLRRLGRHVFPHRPGDDGGGARFDGPMANSLDGVSDRDFALEYLSVASILAVHLSRLSEELVVWANASFRFCQLAGFLFDRQFHVAAEAQSGRGGTGAGQIRPGDRRVLNGLLIV